MQPKAFDLCTSDIFGRYLIEASAGTGKTYSLEHLVLRFIVEAQVPVDRILIVTFTKAATAEIKERVHKVLRRISRAMSSGEELKDKTEAAMVQMWHKDGRDSLLRINQALEAFDDACVQTIHSFCQKMLTEFNFTRAGDYDVSVGADLGLERVVIEEFLRKEAVKLSPEDAQKLLSLGCFETILCKLAEAGDTIDIKCCPELQGPIDPKANESEEQTRLRLLLAGILERFVQEAPKRLEAFEKQASVMSFSSLLVQMYRLVMNNPALVEKIRRRFDAVLIDEFQDTDSIQYGIFKTLFLPDNLKDGPKSVFFVGDPKQAIYGFRMAELSTYLKARAQLLEKNSESVLELKKNFRSTPALVEAINQIFSGQEKSHFLNEELTFTPAQFGSSAAPLVRKIGNVLHPIPVVSFWLQPQDSVLSADDARRLQANRVAQDIANLLADGNVYIKRETIVDGQVRRSRLLKAGDIALLVRNRNNANLIVDALAERGIRASVSGEGDVFQKPEALEIAAVLSAMNNPMDRKLLNSARATRMWGRTMAEIRDAADTLGVADRELIVECAKRFDIAGPSAALNYLQNQAKTSLRLLCVNQGSTVLENYAHIIELLQAQYVRLKTLGAVARWFEKEISSQAAPGDERKLRSVADDNVVKIETVHSSKGLEYPLVYIPWASDMSASSKEKSYFFREDVQEDGKSFKKALFYTASVSNKEHAPTAQRDTEERVRLAYVAMTRASSRLVVSLVYPTKREALKNLMNGYVQGLMGQESYGPMKVDQVDELVRARLRDIQTEISSKDWMSTVNPQDFGENLILSEDFKKPQSWVEVTDDVDTHVTEIKADDACEPLNALPAGHLYSTWARSSFTSIAGELTSSHEVFGEHEGQENVVETNEDAVEAAVNLQPAQTDESETGSIEPLRFFRGADVGDWLHKLFESLFNSGRETDSDFIRQSIDHRLCRAIFMQGKSQEDYQAVAQLAFDMVESVVNCDLLAPTNGKQAFRFNALTQGNRVNEMPFLLSVKNKFLTTSVLMENLQKAGLFFNGEGGAKLTGYLTGAIDMVMFARGKYWIVDWKSNYIGDGTPASYTQRAMIEEIDHKHYRLQYVIYLLALKRHLVSVAGIAQRDVWNHIGGAMYVFLRGVDRNQLLDENGNRNGVYVDCPKKAVDVLDQLLEGK